MRPCSVCKDREALPDWDTCQLCTGMAVRAFERVSRSPGPFKPVTLVLNTVIGQLDRDLSEFLHLTEDPELDAVDAHTLKHHADDLIGVGNKALETLAERSAN